ncbi:MAG: RNase adapter RapZ [Cellvibrionaceae bacterium]|nr:RNase adapter RapZ [Cellvibrionaceae bacterium]
MHLLIISGRSGSGKSTALHVLEDIGFTCIDNFPVSLLPELVKRFDDRRYAISIDARNTAADLELLPNLITLPAMSSLDYQIIFLDADHDELIKRFSETRRKHPLSNAHIDLREAIDKEKQLLKPIMDVATVCIDTSNMKFHDLRDFIKRHLSSDNSAGMALLFQSFGYKYGLPKDADLVFDVRCLPNPHWIPELRPLTGNDQAVIDFLSQQEAVAAMYNDIHHYLTRWLPHFEADNRSYITVAIGCTGGQHRSVYISNKLSQQLANTLNNVQCRHRELRNF